MIGTEYCLQQIDADGPANLLNPHKCTILVVQKTFPAAKKCLNRQNWQKCAALDKAGKKCTLLHKLPNVCGHAALVDTRWTLHANTNQKYKTQIQRQIQIQIQTQTAQCLGGHQVDQAGS